MEHTKGHISQIIGPVIDVYFDTSGVDPEKVLPKIYDALVVKRPDGRELVIEVQQHIGEDTVRCVNQGTNDECYRTADRRNGTVEHGRCLSYTLRGSEIR